MKLRLRASSMHDDRQQMPFPFHDMQDDSKHHNINNNTRNSRRVSLQTTPPYPQSPSYSRRASSSSAATTPLKPILRTSASYHHAQQQLEERASSNSSSYAQHQRNKSSTSSTNSQKQLAFLLPGESQARYSEANTSCSTGSGSSSTPTPTATPPARQHARKSSATSSFSLKSAFDVSPPSSSDRPRRQLKKKTRPSATSVAPVPEGAGRSLHLRSASLPETQQQQPHVMMQSQANTMQRPIGKRTSFDSMSKDLPPLPLNASAPPSSTSSSTLSSIPSSSLASRHRRHESASSATSSVPSTNPIHLPRLKFGQPTGRLGFPEELLSPSLDSPSTPQCHKAAASMSDNQRFSWLGMTPSTSPGNPAKSSKRDSADSRRSSRRRSDMPMSIAMQPSGSGSSHRRTRSSQLDIVPEFTPLGQAPQYTVSGGRRRSTKLLYTQELPDDQEEEREDSLARQTRTSIAHERAVSDSKREALKMTQLWVAMLEDFVLLCDDPSYPSSARSSVSSASSSYVVPLSPVAPEMISLPSLEKETPGSPAPSSECDPAFLALPRSSRARAFPPKLAKVAMPPPPVHDIDDSAGSTTNTYSPLSSSLVASTPASSTGSINGPAGPHKARASFNPFEASFASCTPPAVEESSMPSTSSATGRRASLPGNLPLATQNYSVSRPGKQRPPPLQLASIPDTDESLHTAVPPQTEAQTRLFTSQRSRSLPTEELQPCSYTMRQPVSPKQKKVAEQLGSSTSSTGSNRSSVRYHFPSSQYQNAASTFLEASTRKRNKGMDEGYAGTGLTPTPTSDSFSIPLRSREHSVSSASVASTAPPELTSSAVSRTSSAFTSDSSSLPSPRSANSFSLSQVPQSPGGKRLTTPEHTPWSETMSNDSIQVTPTATRTAPRSQRSQSTSEHIRKRSNETTTMKRSPTLEIVMYGVAM